MTALVHDGPIVRCVTIYRNGNYVEGDMGNGADRVVFEVRVVISSLCLDKAEITTYPRAKQPQWWSHWIHRKALDKFVFELGLRDYQKLIP